MAALYLNGGSFAPPSLRALAATRTSCLAASLSLYSSVSLAFMASALVIALSFSAASRSAPSPGSSGFGASFASLAGFSGFSDFPLGAGFSGFSCGAAGATPVISSAARATASHRFGRGEPLVRGRGGTRGAAAQIIAAAGRRRHAECAARRSRAGATYNDRRPAPDRVRGAE